MDVVARYRELLGFPAEHRLLQYAGRWTTVGDVGSVVFELDDVLMAIGHGPAVRVGMVARNRPAHVATIIGLLATERCLVPITSIQSDAGLVAEIEQLELTAVVADEEDWAREGLADACDRLGVVGILVTVDGPVRQVAGSSDARDDLQTFAGAAVLMPTSGTTGPPKRITYRYTQLNGALERIASYSSATQRSLGGQLEPRNGVVVAPLPLAHVAGFWTVLQALAEGRSIALIDRFRAQEWADLIDEHGVRMAMIPPTTLTMVLDAEVDPAKLATLRAVVCGTAPLDPKIGEAFTARYGVPVLTAYGATEFPGGLVGWSLPDYHEFHETKRGSAGRPRPGIRLRILDPETGADLPTGLEGVICVYSPQATTHTDDGWVRTADLGRVDQDGFLWVVGRSDDAINRGGFKIVPHVVEAVLREHPAVDEVALVGIPDRRLGQVPVAAVTTREIVSESELASFARDRLSSYQVPVRFLIVDDLPRTTSMKISKAAVRELFDDAVTTS